MMLTEMADVFTLFQAWDGSSWLTSDSDMFQGRSWVNIVALPWRQKPVWLFTTKQACDFPRTPRPSAALQSL